ncbi:MAG: NADP-dependent oxidoreductase [Eggerthellaceae bacterium]|nr:NADP-dependent oxidoreductase [Eggerthellaceae bacterium]
MKAVQIDRYSKEIRTVLREVPLPDVGPSDVLVRVEAAAVNPVDLLVLSGSVRLIQDYPMPLTLGNECSGVVEAVGGEVAGFRPGEKVYARLPVAKIGAFAEYVVVDQDALSPMPEGYGFDKAAAIPLTGLTAWQGITEELQAEPGKTLLITGGSGSFGQIAVPLAKALGLHVIVTGNERARERLMALGADRYLDYRKEDYWEILSGMDYVIDALGADEFEKELSVLKPGGKLLSLRAAPNKAFAVSKGFGFAKRTLFAVAGMKYDRAAKKQGKEYRFIFVRSDGAQLREITRIVERERIVPKTDPRTFTLETARDALELVKAGRIQGKVIINPRSK